MQNTNCAPLYPSTLPTLLTALSPLLLGDQKLRKRKVQCVKFHISTFFYKLYKGHKLWILMQLKTQDSVACVFASFDVIMLFDYFHTPAGQSMPIISPLLLALDYGWIPIRMSPGAVLCVHGCPWASIHGCPWCPWVSIQATAARCKMYRQPLPL